ncbi:cytochrome c3 family protein [Thiovibrio frasassiensis]|uniref:Cytochrome c family protein n=1 Tax=Thiovibrio frasassiensis TaxID=2984131 RepID=A0A9X4MI21_9BACT|nr:cytochrome c3 family protein [Thiovibrio frasassiensis]MDG4476726.1 cytochrome c family protein [Thiovibrio frasassiensis]
MKSGTLFGAMLIGGILLSAGSSMGAEAKGASSIVLNGGSLGSVTFNHGRHQGMFPDCQPCHAFFPKESQVVDKMKGAGKLQRKDVMNMCKKCHKELADKGRKTGPTNCKECHKK